MSHSDVAVSLHLYVPPIDICRTFDQRTGHKRKCQVTFWSKFGTRTPFTPSADVSNLFGVFDILFEAIIVLPSS